MEINHKLACRCDVTTSAALHREIRGVKGKDGSSEKAIIECQCGVTGMDAGRVSRQAGRKSAVLPLCRRTPPEHQAHVRAL